MSLELNTELLERLVAPVENDAGDLREDESHNSSYQQIRSARTAARNAERKARLDGDLVFSCPDEWKVVLEKVPTVLATQSKDIELVAWFIEALTRIHGFSGLGFGYELAGRLIAQYGDALYPSLDDEGRLSQLSGLVGLNGVGGEGALEYPVKSLLVTDDIAPGPFSFWQCDELLTVERIGDAKKREARFAQLGFSRSEFEGVIAATQSQFLVGLNDAIAYAAEKYTEFCAIVDSYCVDEDMPTGRVADVLESCARTLNYVAGDRINDAASEQLLDDDVEGTVTETVTDTEGEQRPSKPKQISDRESAIKNLREVARFFRQTEPHSPISYLLEQAIRWSDLSLIELMKELISNKDALTDYQKLVGINSAVQDEA